jgi:hypothetical protein
VKEQNNPISGQELFHKIENGNNVVIHLLVPNRNLWGDGENQGHKKVPWNINKNKVNRVLYIDLHREEKMHEWKPKNEKKFSTKKKHWERNNLVNKGWDHFNFFKPLPGINLLNNNTQPRKWKNITLPFRQLNGW